MSIKIICLGLSLARCGLGVGLAGLVFCETRSCYARRHTEGRRQQLFKYYLQFLYSVLGTSPSSPPWRSKKLNPQSAFVYFWWSWFCYFGLGLKNLPCVS